MITLPEELAVTFPVPQLLAWQKETRTLFALKIAVIYNYERR